MGIIMLKLLWENFKDWVWHLYYGENASIWISGGDYVKNEIVYIDKQRYKVLKYEGISYVGEYYTSYKYIVKPYPYRT